MEPKKLPSDIAGLEKTLGAGAKFQVDQKIYEMNRDERKGGEEQGKQHQGAISSVQKLKDPEINRLTSRLWSPRDLWLNDATWTW